MSAELLTVSACAEAFSRGAVSAREIADSTLARIGQAAGLNAFVAVTGERMLAEAERIDRARAAGKALPPLAAVPYAVKNLFDVAGVTTLAGARLLASNPPAVEDAVLVSRMHEAGALLAGTLNMDALAYGFTTENTHYGATRNPRDTDRSAGGSSGGSAAAVAAGLLPFSLGSDTNGSIRVPSSLCGIFGLKPTYGRLPRSGSFPFVDSFDHLGPFAGNTADLALVYDCLQGADRRDAACAQRPAEPVAAQLGRGAIGFRVGRLAGYFDENAGTEARWAAQAAAQILASEADVELPGTAAARAAAYVITAAEGGALHLNDLRLRPEEFEPLSRERLLAGAMLPAVWVQQAQRYRRRFLQQALALFRHFDLLIAPATPVTAPLLNQPEIQVGEKILPTRPNLGLLTQPISFIGLPVAVVPLWPAGQLPIGVQLIAPPWREDICLRAAYALERAGLANARIGQRR